MTKLSTFSYLNDFNAPLMLIVYVYSTGYSCIKVNKAIVLLFLEKRNPSYFFIFSIASNKIWDQMNSKTLCLFVEITCISAAFNFFSKFQGILLEYLNPSFLVRTKKHVLRELPLNTLNSENNTSKSKIFLEQISFHQYPFKSSVTKS